MSKLDYEAMKNRLKCIKTTIIETIVGIANKTAAKKVQLASGLYFSMAVKPANPKIWHVHSCALGLDGTLVLNVCADAGHSFAMNAEQLMELSVDTLNELAERVRTALPAVEHRDVNGLRVAQLREIVSLPDVDICNPLVALCVDSIEPEFTKIVSVAYDRAVDVLWLEVDAGYARALTTAFSAEEDEDTRTVSQRLKSYPLLVHPNGDLEKLKGLSEAHAAIKHLRSYLKMPKYQNYRGFVLHVYSSGNIVVREII